MLKPEEAERVAPWGESPPRGARRDAAVPHESASIGNPLPAPSVTPETGIHTPLAGQAPGSRFPSFREAKRDFERSYVLRVLEMARGKVAAAARLAKKDRRDFYGLMKKHQIDPGTYRN